MSERESKSKRERERGWTWIKVREILTQCSCKAVLGHVIHFCSFV